MPATPAQQFLTRYGTTTVYLKDKNSLRDVNLLLQQPYALDDHVLVVPDVNLLLQQPDILDANGLVHQM